REAILIADVLFLSINSAMASDVASGTQPTEDLCQVVTRSRPGVVEILIERADGSAVGSGVVIRAGKDGSADIITAAHIVARAENLLVRMFDEKWVEAVVIVEDPERDVALIRTCCVIGVTPVDMSRGEPPLPGSPVFAMGYPMNGAATVTRGIVSAVTENLEYGRIEIQTDAAINPGNSGGPLFSADGQLIGINSYTMKGDDGGFIDGISFAIAMSTVRQVIGE
ncbi:MAG: trypsin-like peptidase domain-containing protein, partial [Chloroflexi bacterium]|nr:trypsin-like peptidase domain-containing protein [Chloroflexota bacterium]